MSTRRTRTRPRRTSPAAPQPRVEQGTGKGRFTNRSRTDGELLPSSDRDRYSALFPEMDVFTIHDGEIVDVPSDAAGYQSVISLGYENRL